MRNIHIKVVGLLVGCGCLSLSLQAKVPDEFIRERDLFIEEMATRHDMDRAWLRGTVGEAVYQQKIIDAMNRPAEKKPWKEYRPIFVNDPRIKGGVEFLQQHRRLLERAERIYGVPAEIIVAIIGVETLYGGNTGSYRVIDALATLGFVHPKRGPFFRSELEEFLLLVGEEPVDVNTTRGSYAGAMGLPQFIPSSYRRYAVDFDGDGRRDLLKDLEDVIGSVANYLAEHGWQRGGSITSRARMLASPPPQYLIEAGMQPSFTLDELAGKGISSEQPQVRTSLSSVIELEGDQGKEYWLGFDNFYVVTRYNHSNLYAMAVVQLAAGIAEGARSENRALFPD